MEKKKKRKAIYRGKGFLGCSVVRISLPVQETTAPSLGWEDPLGDGIGHSLQYSCLGSHGQRSLAVYSAWGSKELNMT